MNSRAIRMVAFGLLMAAFAVAPTEVRAQVPAALEVLAAEYHESEGLLSIQLRAGGSRDVPVEQLTVLVDGVPRTVQADAVRATERPTVLLVIDTSGSMSGTPIAAARDAGRSLVQQLSGDDPVGLLTFANVPALRAPIGTPLATVGTALSSLSASGETALYDALTMGLEVLGSAPAPRAMILLSDGEESGASVASIEDVWQAIAETDVVIHSFALGDEAPGEFLRALSDRTDGSFWSVASDSALEQLFVALGGRLGASRSAAVQVPGLAVGDHDVTVRARVDGRLVEADATFTVRPAVVLTLSAGTPSEPSAPLQVDIAVSSTTAVNLTATLVDTIGAVTLAGTRAIVDPWVLAPGEYQLVVEAWLMGTLVAGEAVPIVVPTLSPSLEVTRTMDGAWRALGRMQPEHRDASAAARLVAMAEGAVIGESTGRELLFTPPESATDLVVELQRSSGDAVLSERFSLQAAGGATSDGSLPLVLVVLAGVGVTAAGGALAWWRRRQRRPAEVRPLVRRIPVVDRTEMTAQGRPTMQGVLQVVGPDDSLRVFTLGARPLRAGTTTDSDIQISGEGVRADHARFSLTPNGDLRVHGMGDRGARPYEGPSDDDWIVLRPGEEVAIGGWRFSFSIAGAESEAS